MQHRTKDNFLVFRKELLTELAKYDYYLLDKILNSRTSAHHLVWNAFKPLEQCPAKSSWIIPLLKKAFPNKAVCKELTADPAEWDQAEIFFWEGNRAQKYVTCDAHYHWLKEKLQQYPTYLFDVRSRPPETLEDATIIDLTLRTPTKLVFLVSKYLNDIYPRTTYDPFRDQIVRSLCVGSYTALKDPAKPRDFYFILLTPGAFQESRLYWYKMTEYMKDPKKIQVKIPYRSAGHRGKVENYPVDFKAMSKRIGWLFWKDVTDVWDKTLSDETILRAKWKERVFKDFEYRGLVGKIYFK